MDEIFLLGQTRLYQKCGPFSQVEYPSEYALCSITFRIEYLSGQTRLNQKYVPVSQVEYPSEYAVLLSE